LLLLGKRGEYHAPKPWDTFRDDVKKYIESEDFFVSRMPNHKMTGAAHDATIKSIRANYDETRQIVKRIKLTAITKPNLENMVDKERNKILYEVLKERLEKHNWDAQKAFAESIYMPTKNPEKDPPRIHGIRVITNDKTGVEVNNGIADNSEMLRTDVFVKKGKKAEYYLCPVYVNHMAKRKLPNKLIAIKKPEEKWIEIDSSFEFLFSLHTNDLVRLESKKEGEIWGYFVSSHRANASIKLKAHDNNKSFSKDGKSGERSGIGIKNLLAFEKYTVDYFGKKSRIKKEVRGELENRTNTKTCKD